MRRRLFVYITFALLFAIAAFRQDEEANRQYQKYIPKGYSLMDMARGYLDDDSLEDMILVLHDDREMDEQDGPEKKHLLNRKMVLLTANADKTYRLAAQNDKAIYHYGYDANFKESFVAVRINNGSFTIDHYGGFAIRWGRGSTFSYDAQLRNWMLTEDEFTSFDANNMKGDEDIELKPEKVYTPAQFGRLPFSRFDIYKEY